MKKQILILIAILFIVPTAINAQTDSNHAEDEKAIRQVVKNITDAWAAGDAVKFADNFTDDVDFTIWNGQFFSGRESNIKGHQQIFETIFKDTKLSGEIRKIRFLSNDVASVQMKTDTIKRSGKKLEDQPPTSPLLVFIRENGKWRVAVFQNTPTIKRDELIIGREVKSKGEK